MLRSLIEAGYWDHMAIASRSLFPYLTKTQALPDEAEPEGVTNAQPLHDVDEVSRQYHDNRYAHMIQQILRPDTALERSDDQANGRSPFQNPDLLGQHDSQCVERCHVGRAS